MAEDKPWRDKDLMLEKYKSQTEKVKDIAEDFDCSRTTVGTWINKHNIVRPWNDPELLHEEYIVENKSTIKIAEEYNCSPTAIANGLHDADITVDRGKSLSAKYASITMVTGGYIMWVDRLSDSSAMYVHRLLAISKYGLEAVANNDVHHKNGIPWDNRLDNIELISKEDHGRLHGEDGGKA